MKLTLHALLPALIMVMLVSCSKYKIDNPLVDKYRDVVVIDIHNHDASNRSYKKSMKIWDAYAIDRIVLFGNVAEPAAVDSDEECWKAYDKYPGRIIPFFGGFDVNNPNCTDYITAKLSMGYQGLGEIIAASTYSPITSNLPWKGEHPMSGYFPEIYQLCSDYNVPILLHIDPPFGTPVTKLEEALDSFPDVNIIFAHANAYNPPSNIRSLLEKHENLYIDFFAGFTAYNPESTNSLEDFADLINDYPSKFMVSTDGGIYVGYDNAYSAIYELFELLDTKVIEAIAHENFETLYN